MEMFAYLWYIRVEGILQPNKQTSGMGKNPNNK